MGLFSKYILLIFPQSFCVCVHVCVQLNYSWSYCLYRFLFFHLASKYLISKTNIRCQKHFHIITVCSCTISCFSSIQFFASLWTVAFQAPYVHGLPCSSPGDLPDPGKQPVSIASTALAGGFFTTSAIWEAQLFIIILLNHHFKWLHNIPSRR